MNLDPGGREPPSRTCEGSEDLEVGDNGSLGHLADRESVADDQLSCEREYDGERGF